MYPLRKSWLIQNKCKARITALRQTFRRVLCTSTCKRAKQISPRSRVDSLCKFAGESGGVEKLRRRSRSYIKPLTHLPIWRGEVAEFVDTDRRQRTRFNENGYRGNRMTKTQVDIISSVRRRRRWSRAEKERIVAAAMEPGAVTSAVAREAGIQASQLFRWRQQLHGQWLPGLHR